jgi:hypothetical protein
MYLLSEVGNLSHSLAILCRDLCFLDPKDFKIIWFSNILTLNLLVPYFTLLSYKDLIPSLQIADPLSKDISATLEYRRNQSIKYQEHVISTK